MKRQLEEVLSEIFQKWVADANVTVQQADDVSHGEYTTNAALIYAKQLNKKPRELAQEIVNGLAVHSSQFTANKLDHSSDQIDQKSNFISSKSHQLQDIESIEIAGPGFINFHLSASGLSKVVPIVLEKRNGFGTIQKVHSSQFAVRSKKIMVEFAHPNTHKAFHIGHLRNISTGESIVRLLESQGNEVIRANYQGDVGMHIAKAMYGLLDIEENNKQYKNYSSSEARSDNNKSKFSTSSNNKLVHERVGFLGKAYAAGSQAYEEDPQAKEKIHDYNYLVYASAQRFQSEKGITPSSTNYLRFVPGREAEVERVYQVWKETRQWSLDYFDSIYKRVGTHYDRFYFESECLKGVDLAKEAVQKGVLKESDGAIIFDGKPQGVDTRVFVNSLGLPTYEGKELALAYLELTEHGKLDQIIHVVGPEQSSFFKTMFKAEELLGIQQGQQFHLAYGWVRLKHGKMSSRLGNVVLGEDLIEETKKAITEIISASEYSTEEKELITEKAAIAAIKYSFLKSSVYNEIVFDMEEAVNIHGDSGPYLMYTYARAKSVLRKGESNTLNYSEAENDIDHTKNIPAELNPEEREVLRLLHYFPDTVTKAATEMSPHYLATHLFQLAQAFNLFYAKHSILDSSKVEVSAKGRSTFGGGSSPFRIALTKAVAQVIKNGLYLLGIETVERM